ncbi:MAG: hypothetical protein K2J76_07680 [Oscillospiraceae bacterium]|nr:hypothetical protein [Oscillospiraceae bacterium]
MENFRKQAKRTLKIYIFVLAVAIVLWVVFTVLEIAGGENNSSNFRNGACAGIATLMALNIVRYSAALKDDEKLKKLYIAETDERTRLIYEKSNSSSFRTLIIVLGLSTIVSSFYSDTVFYTLIAVIFVIIFIQAIYSFYYRRKY